MTYRMNRFLFLGVALLLAARAVAQSPDEIVASARAAHGDLAAASRSGVTSRGGGSILGMDSSWSFTFQGDRYIEQLTGKGGGEEWTMIEAHDGKTAWRRDWSGLVLPRDLSDREEALALAAIRSFRWLEKDGPFELSDPKSEGDLQILAWRMRDGMAHGKIGIDKKSHLVAYVERDTPAGADRWEFGDYREVSVGNAKAKYPYTIQRRLAGMSDTYTVKDIAMKTADPADPFRFVPQPLAVETRKAEAKVESKWVPQGLVLVKPLVNGKDVGWFILDSGAGGMVIDKKAAKDLGMPEFGQVAAIGVGGVEKSSWFKADSFEVGGVRMTRMPMVGIDLGLIGLALGIKCAGIVGWDLFCRSVVELDVAGKQVAIHAPNGFDGSTLKWQPLRFSDNHPIVECRFEGDRKGLFRLDTGAATTVTFHSPAVKSMKLLEGRETKTQMLGGVGGGSPTEQGPLEWFEVGGKRFEKPTVTFATGDVGPLADKYTVGNVGQVFLRPFRIVLDYAGARIAFVESKQSSAKPSRHP